MGPLAVYQLARDAGLDHEQAVIATAVAWGESGLNPRAVGDQGLVDSEWGPSIGLWQVRSLKADGGTGRNRDADRLADPAFNARAMAAISSGGTNWQPWTVYRTGVYRQHLDAVREAVGAVQEEHVMEFVSRAEWGARSPRSTTAMGGVRGVAVHWEGPHMGWPWDHGRCAGKVAGFQAYHMDNQGWNDIAYNALVCGHGVVFEGRSRNRGGANGDSASNAAYFSICYIGGEGDPFTDEAKTGINDAAKWLEAAHLEWTGHRDHAQTACPGDEIYGWVHAGHPSGGGSTEGDDMFTDEDRALLRDVATGLAEWKDGKLPSPLIDDIRARLAALEARPSGGGTTGTLAVSGELKVSSAPPRRSQADDQVDLTP